MSLHGMNRARETILHFLVAAGTGAGIGLSLSGFHFFWLAWIVLAPFLVAVRRAPLKRAIGMAVVAALAEAAYVWHWLPMAIMHMTRKAGLAIGVWSILALYWSVLFCVFVLLARLAGLIHERHTSGKWAEIAPTAVMPLVWIILEYLHTQLMTRLSLIFFPMIGYSQSGMPEMVQMAAFTGVYGASFAIVLCNAAIAQSVVGRKWRPAIIAGLTVILCFAFGFARIRMGKFPSAGKRVKVAVLQGNIQAYEKFDRSKSNFIAARYMELCKKAAESGPDLVVWSETAIPWPLAENDDLAEVALRITSPSKACHIIGAPFCAPGSTNIFYNTAFLVLPDGLVTSQYNKLRMLAFAEVAVTIPGFAGPQKMHPTAPSYTGGTEMALLASPFGNIGVNLCNENFYAGMNRRTASEGARIIVDMANDIWFQTDMPLRQHFGVNVFRAVEAGRDVIVGNNAGISGIIDAYGRIRCSGGTRTHLCLSGEAGTNSRMTFYVKHGDWFVLVCTVCLALVFAAPLMRPRRSGDRQT